MVSSFRVVYFVNSNCTKRKTNRRTLPAQKITTKNGSTKKITLYFGVSKEIPSHKEIGVANKS